jgi:hypothetical protein
MYQILHECSEVYIGQTGSSIEARCKKHMRHIHLEHQEKSAVVEHSINIGHDIDFSSICMLHKAAGWLHIELGLVLSCD